MWLATSAWLERLRLKPWRQGCGLVWLALDRGEVSAQLDASEPPVCVCLWCWAVCAADARCVTLQLLCECSQRAKLLWRTRRAEGPGNALSYCSHTHGSDAGLPAHAHTPRPSHRTLLTSHCKYARVWRTTEQ